MAPSTQKALLLDEKFGNFAVNTIPVPTPGPGEILVKVQAASLNPVDWKKHKYGVYIESYPTILGTDISGDVEEVGQGVTDLKKGDRVVLQGQFKNNYAGFQQYALGVATAVAKIPSNISYDEAATLPVALTSPFVGLYNQQPHGCGLVPPVTPEGKGKYAGNPIVILGGSGSVGQNAIQFAKLSGFSPIITTASLGHVEFLKSLGATHVIDRSVSASALASEVGRITQNAPIKYAVDSVSLADTQQAAYDLLAPGGQLAIFLGVAVKPVEGKRIFSVVGFARHPPNVELLETLYHDNLERLLEEGAIKPNRPEVLPGGLEGIPDGLKRLEAGKVSRSKLVAHPQETT
ncbi:GroES-like protein [Phlegmacium glaucopus]|nr:GroES-like protein [Phlegmacium glaucopus]